MGKKNKKKKDELTAEETGAYAVFLAKEDQILAWAREHEDAILGVVVSNKIPDDANFLANLAMLAMSAMIRHRADLIQEGQK